MLTLNAAIVELLRTYPFTMLAGINLLLVAVLLFVTRR